MSVIQRSISRLLARALLCIGVALCCSLSAADDEKTGSDSYLNSASPVENWQFSQEPRAQDRFVLGARGCRDCVSDGGLTLTAGLTKALSFESLLDLDLEVSPVYQRAVLSYGRLLRDETNALYGSVFYNTGSIDFDFESGIAEVDLHQYGAQLNLMRRYQSGSYGLSFNTEQTEQAQPLDARYFQRSVDSTTVFYKDPRKVSVGATHSLNLQADLLIGSNVLVYGSLGIENRRFSRSQEGELNEWQNRGSVAMQWHVNEEFGVNLGVDYDLAMTSAFAEIGYRNWSLRLERGGSSGLANINSAVISYEFGLPGIGRMLRRSQGATAFSLADLNGEMQRSQSYIPREFTARIDDSAKAEELLRIDHSINGDGVSVNSDGNVAVDAGQGILFIERVMRNKQEIDAQEYFTVEDSRLRFSGRALAKPSDGLDLYEVYVIDAMDERYVIAITVES